METRCPGEKGVDGGGKVLVHQEPAGGGRRAQNLPPKGTAASGLQGEKAGLTAQTDLETSLVQQVESGGVMCTSQALERVRWPPRPQKSEYLPRGTGVS